MGSLNLSCARFLLSMLGRASDGGLRCWGALESADGTDRLHGLLSDHMRYKDDAHICIRSTF